MAGGAEDFGWSKAGYLLQDRACKAGRWDARLACFLRGSLRAAEEKAFEQQLKYDVIKLVEWIPMLS